MFVLLHVIQGRCRISILLKFIDDVVETVSLGDETKIMTTQFVVERSSVHLIECNLRHKITSHTVTHPFSSTWLKSEQSILAYGNLTGFTRLAASACFMALALQSQRPGRQGSRRLPCGLAVNLVPQRNHCSTAITV